MDPPRRSTVRFRPCFRTDSRPALMPSGDLSPATLCPRGTIAPRGNLDATSPPPPRTIDHRRVPGEQRPVASRLTGCRILYMLGCIDSIILQEISTHDR